jgi:DNA-binding NtrC family response regulator
MADETVKRITRTVVRGASLVGADGRELVVGTEPVTIGRAASAHLCVADREVSALHCELVATRQGVVLKDLGSTNGTFIDSVGIRECVLTSPCTIRVGDTLLHFTPSSPAVIEGTAAPRGRFGPLRGSSAAMQRLYGVLERIAPTELSVLLTGETGTGKELVARAIHAHSRRSAGPFIVIDCGALPSGLAEATLFGHERGAFTGAVARAEGAFRAAHGGTVFLDEIGELPEEMQPKLLRAIAERAIKPVGSAHYAGVDVRVVAATRRDLRRAMNAARFREDLYFRIAQVRVELPSLRERLEDLPELVAAACERVDGAAPSAAVASYVKRRFAGYDWPGNVRELVNIASVLAALGESGAEQVLPVEGAPDAASPQTPERYLEARRRFEERYFRTLLDDTDGNISEIARRCGLARHQVRAHLRKLGITR